MTSVDKTGKTFPVLKNDLLLRAARGEPTERVPIWIMRQAGRYLPEFIEIFKKHKFFELCESPTLACELTLQPIRRFDLDGSIIFSDILVIPQALGMHIDMPHGKGPTFSEPLKCPDDLEKLDENVDVKTALNYVYEAITLTRHKLEGKVPLFGFCGAPFTLMAFMIEGSSSKTNSKVMKWLYVHPEASHKLLQMLADVSIRYLIEQVRAGAQILQVFETQGSPMNQEMFTRFSLPYLKQIAKGVKEGLKSQNLEAVPMVIFAKDLFFAMEELSKAGYDVMSIDWKVKPKHVRQEVGPHMTLQGNLDPCALYAPKEKLRERVKEMLQAFGTQRYIANLGHGMYPDHDPEHVKEFIDAVHQYSEDMNAKAA